MAEYFSIVCVYHSLLSVHLVMDLGCAHILAIVNNCVCVCVCVFSCVRLFVTPWTAAPQAPLSMEFSKQEYWSGLLFLFPGDLPT